MLQKIVLALLLGALLTLAKASAEDKAKPSDAPGSVASKEIEKNGGVYTYDETSKGFLQKFTVSDTSVSKKLQKELNRYGRLVFDTSGMKVKEVPATFYVPGDLWVTGYEKKIIMDDDSFFLVSKDKKIVVFQASSVGRSDSSKDDKDKYRDVAWKRVKAAIDELGLEITEPHADELTNSVSLGRIKVPHWLYVNKKRYRSAKYGEIECVASLTSIAVSMKGDRILQIIDVPVIRPEKESVKCTENEILECAEKSFPDLPRGISKACLVVYDEQRFAFSLDHQPRKPFLAWRVEWKANSRLVAYAFIDAESQKVIELIDMRTL